MIQNFVHKKENLIKSHFICLNLEGLLTEEQFRILHVVEVVEGHLESQNDHRLRETDPSFLILHFELKILHCLRNHQEHFPFNGGLNLDGVDPSKDRPVAQVEKHSNKFGILLATDELKHSIHTLLVKGYVYFAIEAFLGLPCFNRDDCFGKFLVETFQK